MSITSKTENYNRVIKDRWHTPGHKGYLWADDITEIGDKGGNIFPADDVAESEKIAAKAYGAKKLRFLTGGSSMGIKAAVLSVGGGIIAGRYAHQSIFEAADLAKVNIFLINNEIIDGLPAPLTIKQVEKAIADFPEAKAVVIESPDYYGRVCDSKIAEVVKNAGKILIADSAHGAHFVFDKELFPPSFSGTADFCNMSAHKTLCALTMGAYLVVNNEEYFDKVDKNLKNLGTTSPLYPLLASLEKAVEIGKMQSAVYAKLKMFVYDFKKDIPVLKNDDFTRIVVDAQKLKTTGEKLYFKLFEKGISAEKYTDRYVVFIATPFDDEDKFKRLKEAILA